MKTPLCGTARHGIVRQLALLCKGIKGQNPLLQVSELVPRMRTNCCSLENRKILFLVVIIVITWTLSFQAHLEVPVETLPIKLFLQLLASFFDWGLLSSSSSHTWKLWLLLFVRSAISTCTSLLTLQLIFLWNSYFLRANITWAMWQ